MNRKFKWASELNGPRSKQSQLPKDILRSGGLVLLTKPAETVRLKLGAFRLNRKA